MSRCNNRKLSRRSRGKSCPADVTFRNDITNFETGIIRKSRSINLAQTLEKESNFTRESWQSFPNVLYDKLGVRVGDENLTKKASPILLLQNYSLTGGIAHNLFCRKLADAHKPSHSAVDVCNQHTSLNNLSLVHLCPDVLSSFAKASTSDIATGLDQISAHDNVRFTTHEKRVKCEINASCLRQSVGQDDNRALLKASEHTRETLSNTDLPRKYLENSSPCSEANQKPTTDEIYSSFKEHDEQTLTDNNHILSEFVKASENQDKTLSALDERKQDLDDSFLQSLDKKQIPKQTTPSKNSSINEQFLKDNACCKLLTFVEDRRNGQNVSPNLNEPGRHLDESFIRRILQEVKSLEVDSEDDLNRFSRALDLTAFKDSDVARLESDIQGTEVLVENLADQVKEAKKEIEMTTQKQENEINDLILLNEEMQTIWSAKEAEVREMLERFSAYRSAVEADSKEKDDLFSEEIHKRETLIKDLQLTKDALQDELERQTEVFREVLNDLQHFEATQVQQLGDVNQLVACLLEKFSDQEASLVCRSISVKLETSIATIKEKDYARYISCLNIAGMDTKSLKELKGNNSKKKLGESFSSSMDEGKGYSILSSSDGERNEITGPEQFSSEDFRCCTPTAIIDDEFYETLDEDFARLLNEMNETGHDGLVEGYIAKKTIITFLEEQSSKYQFLCREKDAEIQHWQRKHKQDTQDLQSILEEQERVEAKTNESLVQLQSEIEKLQQRNKFLESEIEFAKEQGEDDVCLLKESFQKDLSAQLRRQSQSFFFAEESVRNELAEMQSKNEELERNNQDLKQEIEEHFGEIRSWVSDILTLSEGEYNEEFNSITDVLAKLHKIIYENKRTMDALQGELEEYKKKMYESSPPDTLSRSWGGSSNSMELQKELCRNCKQTKWQRFLMGSFDVVDSSLENKQDEIARFVDRLGIDDGSKQRKKHSLKDSLELADDQLEHLQRLSRQGFGSLETLGEDSLEESDGGNSGDNDVVDGQNGFKLGDDIHQQSNAECEDDLPSGFGNVENKDELLRDDVECGDKFYSDNAECGDELSNSDAESGDAIPNAYDRKDDNFTDRTDNNSASNANKENVENFDEAWKNIHVSPRLLTQYSILSDVESNNFHKDSNFESDKLEREGNMEVDVEEENDRNLFSEDGDNDEHWLMEQDNDHQLLIDEGNNGYEDDEDMVNVVNLYKSLIVESDQPHFPIPKIVVEKDFNDNFLEQESEEENYFDKVSDMAPNEEFDGESCNQNGKLSDHVDNNSDESVEPDPKIPVVKEFEESNQMVQRDEIKEKNIVKPRRNVSESWSIRVDPKNSIFEFVGELGDEPASYATCKHCIENLKNFKMQLTDVIANQRKDQENKISKELEETKSELRELQSEYEKLDSICTDYRNYVDEYSGNLKRKNEELRKVKLNSNIMETEIEWLRQALGITTNYAAF